MHFVHEYSSLHRDPSKPRRGKQCMSTVSIFAPWLLSNSSLGRESSETPRFSLIDGSDSSGRCEVTVREALMAYGGLEAKARQERQSPRVCLGWQQRRRYCRSLIRSQGTLDPDETTNEC